MGARNPGALPPLPAARGYLTGAHVLGQLQAPAPVTVAGVAPGGVDAGLLTAFLHALVHVCSHKEAPETAGLPESLPPSHLSGCEAQRGAPGGPGAHSHPARRLLPGDMVACLHGGHRHGQVGTGCQARGSGAGLCPGVARVGEPGWSGGLREVGWDHLSPSSWRGSPRPQAGKWWEAVWLFGPLDMAGPGARGAGEKAAPRIQAARPIPLCLWGGAGCTRDKGHVTCTVKQGPCMCRWGRGHVNVCAGEAEATSRVCR